MLYMSGPVFRCEFNGDVRFTIRLTKYGNFSKYVSVYMFSSTVFQEEFNHDGDYVIQRVYCGNI